MAQQTSDRVVTGEPTSPARRRLLAGLLTASTAALIPWALAQEVPDEARGAFAAVSAILVGRTSLDTGQAKRIYDALVADDAHFPADVQALLAWINQRRIDPMQLQSALDGENVPWATLPRRIMRAWTLGVVGEGRNARCIAYENALNAVMVADVLKPPTYAYGAYGSWADKPV